MGLASNYFFHRTRSCDFQNYRKSQQPQCRAKKTCDKSEVFLDYDFISGGIRTRVAQPRAQRRNHFYQLPTSFSTRLMPLSYNFPSPVYAEVSDSLEFHAMTQ